MQAQFMQAQFIQAQFIRTSSSRVTNGRWGGVRQATRAPREPADIVLRTQPTASRRA